MSQETWPWPWRIIADDSTALAFGKSINPAVADTVVRELAREVPPGHLLHGATCRALAYDCQSMRDFLFETDHPDAPYAEVHFTWSEEKDPRWPPVFCHPNRPSFLRAARRRTRFERLLHTVLFWRRPA